MSNENKTDAQYMLHPERHDDEEYFQYKVRRQSVNRFLKSRLKGTKFYDSNERDPRTGKKVPYVKQR